MSAKNKDVYDILWTFAYLTVHRYGATPSGEVLLVLTIVLLDQWNQHVTMSELAQVTGLPKSNVSRYVSDQLRIGHLSEQIDPRDRRRRVLHPTDAGRKEQKWHLSHVQKLTDMKKAAGEDREFDMVAMLLELTRELRQLPEEQAASG